LALITTLSHILKLEDELEMIESDRNAALREDQMDALWNLAGPSLDLLASHVLPSVARGLPEGAGE
jgi:hypothetical protein